MGRKMVVFPSHSNRFARTLRPHCNRFAPSNTIIVQGCSSKRQTYGVIRYSFKISNPKNRVLRNVLESSSATGELRIPELWKTLETACNSCTIASLALHALGSCYAENLIISHQFSSSETQNLPKGFCLASFSVPPMISCPLASRSHGSGTKSSSPWCLAATATGKMASMSLPMRCGSTTCL